MPIAEVEGYVEATVLDGACPIVVSECIHKCSVNILNNAMKELVSLH